MSQAKLDGVSTGDHDVPKSQYLEGKQLLVAFIGLLIAVLLMTLDQTIVATALPRIVSAFNALSSVTWVVTAYYLTLGGCMLVIGQILMLSRKKLVFLAAITLFETGSLICAVSPSMPVLIFGRAVAGCGAAGIQVSVSTIIPDITPLEKRPMLFASFGGVLAISTVAGPVLGGAFTVGDGVSGLKLCLTQLNRQCGALAIFLVLLFLKSSPPSVSVVSFGTSSMWLRIDWIGGALVTGFFTCLLLPLQWGGNTKPWNSPTVIALFVVAGVLFAMFLPWERYKGKQAMIPLDIISNRTALGCGISGFLGYFALLLATYYLPLWYQAHGSSATRSGLDILPFLIAVIVGSGISGGVVTKTGAAVHSRRQLAVGASHRVSNFLSRLQAGVGLVFQNVIVAIQAEYADNEVLIPQATAFVNFCQILGGIVSISMAGSIFANELRRNVPIYAPDLTSAMLSAILQSVTAIQE
ncbi:MFS general substrate transporter [Phlebopus sp. FC_14]|nr:MFS general substrate transporter [Phlebopus sp. FC_14]